MIIRYCGGCKKLLEPICFVSFLHCEQVFTTRISRPCYAFWPGECPSDIQADDGTGACGSPLGGVPNIYRRFVKGFADIAHPLHCVAEAGSDFQWTEECEQAFNS